MYIKQLRTTKDEGLNEPWPIYLFLVYLPVFIKYCYCIFITRYNPNVLYITRILYTLPYYAGLFNIRVSTYIPCGYWIIPMYVNDYCNRWSVERIAMLWTNKATKSTDDYLSFVIWLMASNITTPNPWRHHLIWISL